MSRTGQRSTSSSDLRTQLQSGVVVGDGAMGTMLHAVGASLDRCLPELNLSRPELVRDIHRAYIDAGSAVVETNTFGANRVSMERFGLADEVELVNEAAVRLVAAVRRDAGRDLLIGGSIGPAVAPGSPQRDVEAGIDALLEQAEHLERAGVELFVLETFGDLGHLAAITAALRARTNLPVIAQATFTEEGQTLSGDSPEYVAHVLEDAGADVIGVNCTLGPGGTVPLIEAFAATTDLPISAQPNAGPPRRVRGRIEYRPNEDYFARVAVNFVRAGARLVGGCCGTTPRHIEAIVRHLGDAPAVEDEDVQAAEAWAVPTTHHAPGSFTAKLAAREFVIAAEVVAPAAESLESALNDATKLLDAGATTLVVAPAKPSASSMGSISFSVVLNDRLGVEPIVAVATYQNSVLGLEADLLGAHALGVRTVLCVNGVPQPQGDYPAVAQLFEVSATDLIDSLTALNGARGGGGLRATAFLAGGQLDPSAAEPDTEVTRVHADLAAGAEFLVTTPTFELNEIDALLDALNRPTVPVLLGVAPLSGFAQAEYLHFEWPQVTISERVLERLRSAGPTAAQVGREIACELVSSASGFAGVVVYRAPGADVTALIRDVSALRSPEVARHH